MPLYAQLWIERPDARTVVASVTTKPITFGRAPSNDVAFTDETVSWQHATVWIERGAVWVRDIGSRNGTFVNGERIAGPRVVADGDRLGIGPVMELRVALNGTSADGAAAFAVEDLGLGIVYSTRGDRFVFGSVPGADVPVDCPTTTILFTGNMEIWLGMDSEDRPLALGEVFTVGGRSFRVKLGDATRAPTIDVANDRYPYVMEVSLTGARGPEAVLTDPPRDRVHRVEADNRAVLLYILGRQIQADLDAGKERAECGWISDDDAAVGVWGRAQALRDVNGLHVLVHRVRRELAEAGFDPWFIEKRRRCIRARVARVTLR